MINSIENDFKTTWLNEIDYIAAASAAAGPPSHPFVEFHSITTTSEPPHASTFTLLKTFLTHFVLAIYPIQYQK